MAQTKANISVIQIGTRLVFVVGNGSYLTRDPNLENQESTTLFQFPSVDPIPLPAPVWLFKLLGDVTLVLHFLAMQLLVGSLTLATVWNFLGKKHSVRRDGSDAVIRKVPTLMTYVINFGVPPLLFSQVLYGRALYTSSVLVGFYWISVIVVLTLTYFLLYKCADRANSGHAWWGYSLLSWVGVVYIAKIFSINMTLMLRPEAWQPLYQASGGLVMIFPTGDPSTTPRFFFMLAGGFGLSGAGLLFLSAFGNEKPEVVGFLRKWGGIFAAGFLALEMAAGVWVYRVQPAVVQDGIMSGTLTSYALWAWAVFTVLAVVASLIAAFWGKTGSKILAATAILFGALGTAGFVVVRDGIRDLTLLSKGFDVWQRTVVSNWSVVLLFLALFVGGLALIGFLLVLVARSAKQIANQTAVAAFAGEADLQNLLEEKDDQ